MFKSLKEKLKSWILRTKEETEEKVVETKKETKTKEIKGEKEKKKKEPEKQDKKTKKNKTSSKSKKEEKIEKKLIKELKKESYKEPKKEFNLATKNFQQKIQSKEEIKEEEEIKNKLNKEKELHKKEERETLKEINEIQEPEKETKEKEEKPEETKKQGFFASLFGKKSNEQEETLKEKETKEEKKELVKETKKEKEKKEAETEEEKPKEKETKKPLFSFFRKSLSLEKFEELFEELELILMQNNVAYSAIQKIKESLKDKLVGSTDTDIENALKTSIKELLINPPNLINQIKEKKEKPFIILFAGINGAGKTTTIAKVAHLLKKNNLSVCLASADTFRAAAIEQLQIHADRLKIPLIKKDYGADPASVGFDAIKYAKKNNIDVVLIDTAGRMNNRNTLMKEIEKISRVNNPDLKIFLGESITGNDATEQAKDFNDAIKIDGIILSKADVDEKGGTAISVSQVTSKPIYYLGTGQNYDDLELFDKEKLINKIFS